MTALTLFPEYLTPEQRERVLGPLTRAQLDMVCDMAGAVALVTRVHVLSDGTYLADIKEGTRK